MPNLDAPARLAFWPKFPGDQGRHYAALRQALTDAAQPPSDTSLHRDPERQNSEAA